MNQPSLSANKSYRIGRIDFILFGLIAAVSWLLFIYVDIMETSNHTTIFLQSLFSGKLFEFYNIVAAHQNDLYYINGANYNILIYIAFGIWQLPLFLLNLIFHFPRIEILLFIWSKLLPVVAFAGSGMLISKICGQLGAEQDTARFAGFCYLLHPVALFAPLIMGQYDSLMIFLLLWSLTYYFKGDMPRFTVLMALAVCFKMFAVFIFIPLLLLRKKRLPEILLYGIVAAAPLLVTSLLFRQTNASASFLAEMFQRLFDNKIFSLPAFIAVFVLISIWCWFQPAPDNSADRRALTVGLFVFGALFLFIEFHPQWLLLLITFVVPVALLSNNKEIYLYLTLITSVAFSLYLWRHFSGHFETNLLWYGALYFTDAIPPGSPFRSMYTLLNRSVIPLMMESLLPLSIAGTLFVYLPLFQRKSLADSCYSGTVKKYKLYVWLVFAAGFAALLFGIFVPHLMR